MGNQANDATVLGSGCRLEGDIALAGELIVDGVVAGNGQVEGNLILSPGAAWNGHVRVASAAVGGEINGDIYATGALELLPTARVTGNVVSPRILIRPGAIVNGWMITSDTPPAGLLTDARDEAAAEEVSVGQPVQQVVGE